MLNRRKRIAGFMKFGKGVGKGIGNVSRRYINGNTGKKAAKLAAIAAGGAVLGMVGLSAGLASGNDADIVKYGTAGAAGGAFLTNEAIKQGKTIKQGVINAKDTFQKGYYGKDYNDEILNPKSDKAWKKDPKTKEYFQTRYKDSNWKEKMNQALELRKLGMTNQSDIDRAIKLKEEQPDLTIQQAGNAVQVARNVTSRDEYIKKGGKQKIYGQVLNMLNGDKDAADRAMTAIDSVLKERNNNKDDEEGKA